jgi:hypothetical protein
MRNCFSPNFPNFFVEKFHQKKTTACNMVLVIWVQDEFNGKYAA